MRPGSSFTSFPVSSCSTKFDLHDETRSSFSGKYRRTGHFIFPKSFNKVISYLFVKFGVLGIEYPFKELSKPVGRWLQQHAAYDLFSSPTQHLDHTKCDAVDPQKQDGVGYKNPCKYGKVYIDEKGRCMHKRIKEHDRNVRLSRIQTSAVSQQPIRPVIIRFRTRLSVLAETLTTVVFSEPFIV